jgi:uncharacterized membrane protein
MHKALWAVQILLGVVFLGYGVAHFIVPAGLPAPMSWMYDLDSTVHAISGAAEILGGLGLILPGLTRIQTWLTPLAALGLVAVMILALLFHVTRGELTNVGFTAFFGLLAAFVAYGRWRLHPLPGKAASAA